MVFSMMGTPTNNDKDGDGREQGGKDPVEGKEMREADNQNSLQESSQKEHSGADGAGASGREGGAGRSKKDKGKEARKTLFWAALFIALVGVGVSVELTRVHHKAHRDVASSCDLSKKVSCTSIALTEEAVFLRVPISVWGICTYLAFGVLALWGVALKERKTFPWGLFFWMGAATVLYSLWLAYIAYVKYGFVCIWCTLLYAVNMALMVMGVVGMRKNKGGMVSSLRDELAYLWRVKELTLPLVVLAGAIAGGLIYFYPAHPEVGAKEKDVDFSGKIHVGRRQHREGSKARGARKQGRQAGRKGPGDVPGPSRDVRDENGVPMVGKWRLIEPDTPARGAKNPDIILVEFSDYECPFCAKAHLNVQKAYNKYKHRMKMYHRHFPLDQACNRLLNRPYHPNACNAAKAAVCAAKMGKFWKMDHLLFMNKGQHTGAGLMKLVANAGLDAGKFKQCMKSPETLKVVKRDIEVALALKARGTPTFVFYGPHLERVKASGLIGVKVFDKLFQELDKAKAKAKDKAKAAAEAAAQRGEGAAPRPGAAKGEASHKKPRARPEGEKPR